MDQEPLLVTAPILTVKSRTIASLSTPVKPQASPSNRNLTSPLQEIDLKRTTRPKIRGNMANLLRRRCCIRSLQQRSMAVVVAIQQRPKAFRIDNDDEDEDMALLTESSSRTASSSFDIDDSEGKNLLG
jgi:hypothetical protein